MDRYMNVRRSGHIEENQERTVSKEKFHHSKVPVVLNISIGQNMVKMNTDASLSIRVN